MTLRDIRMPRFPECWETCGSCGSGDIFVLEVHAKPGDTMRFDDPLITLETGKVSLDIPCPHAGTIVEVHVAENDILGEGDLIATIEAM